MKIEIPEGFFPPPGVAFSSYKQRDLAILLHNNGCLNVQLNTGERWADEDQWTPGFATPQSYRLAPPTPRKVGPFESVYECDGKKTQGPRVSAYYKAAGEADKCKMKKYRVIMTATAEEIL